MVKKNFERVTELFLLLLFSIPALSPLFHNTPMVSADGLLHLYRLVELDTLWRSGVFFSRWFPDVAYGYGLPLFNYYAPLAYYLTLPLHLVGVPFTTTLNLSLGAALVVGAVGMFYFTRALLPTLSLRGVPSAMRSMSSPQSPTNSKSDVSLRGALSATKQSQNNSTAQPPTDSKSKVSLQESPSAMQRLSDTASLITDYRSALPPLVAALAYLYTPYLLFNALDRANLAEQWALAFAPFALWRFFILIQKPTALNWVLAILTFAAVMLSHNVTSFLFAPLLFLFILASLASKFFNSPKSQIKTPKLVLNKAEGSKIARSPVSSLQSLFSPSLPLSLLPLSAFLLALTLSSFFWLPALLERDFVQIARVIVTPDFDYHFNFVNPWELIALLPRADTGRMNPVFPATLGPVEVLAALAGIVLLIRRYRPRQMLPWLALGVSALVLTLLMLSLSQPLWESISLLSFVQLPMRLRGLVALCLAPLIGVFVLLLSSRWTIVKWLVLIAIVLTALPLLYPRRDGVTPHTPTLTDMFAYEQASGAFGTTSFGEYLPVWVQNPPDKSPFTDIYARNEIPNRLVIPEGVTLCGTDIHPTTQIICTASTDSWHAIFQSFYFPGWQVLFNGQPLTITPTPRTGLISFDVPGSGTLTIQYIGTLIENISNWLSLASALIVLGVFLLALLKLNLASRFPILANNPITQSPNPLVSGLRSPVSSLQSPVSSLPSPLSPSLHPSLSPSLPLFLLALFLIALKFLYADRPNNLFVSQFDGIHVDGVGVERQAWFSNELYLLGYDYNGYGIGLEGPHFGATRGETETITIYWRALPGMHRNLSTYVHLISPADGRVLAQKDSLHPGNLPTTRWAPNLYIADIHQIQMPADLAPGYYELTIGVYDPQTNERLQTTEGSPEITLPIIIVH